MSNDVRNTPAKAREVENTRLVWLDGELRAEAALDLDAYLAAQRASEVSTWDEADLPAYVERHALLVRLVAERPAGDDHPHTFGLRKVTPRITRRPDERRVAGWLVAPCACGHEYLAPNA